MSVSLRRERMRRFAGVVCAALVTCVASAAFAAVREGDRASDFSLSALGGGKLSLTQFRGKIVILDFWAEWCEPCKKELPQLQTLADEFKNKDVVVLTISISKQKSNAEKLVGDLKLAMPVALDPSGAVAAAYDLPKMPTSFVIDKKGIVRAVHEGFEGSKDVEKFRREIQQLVK